MKEYEKPSVEVVISNDDDIITISELTNGGYGDGKGTTGSWDS